MSGPRRTHSRAVSPGGFGERAQRVATDPALGSVVRRGELLRQLAGGRAQLRANAARLTNSSLAPAQFSICVQACGLASSSLKHAVSARAQLSKSLAQRFICAGVTSAGSSIIVASMRAS